MATFDELMKKEHVANHPIFNKSRKVAQESSLDKTDLNDLLSQAINPNQQTQNEGTNLRGLVFAASRAIEDTLAQFILPIAPRVAYNKTSDLKYARGDQSKIIEGTVLFNINFISESGVKKHATTAVRVVNGQATPPSIVNIDERAYVFSQDTMDEVLNRVTSYELLELRQEFEPPLNKQDREVAVALRNSIGWRARHLMDGYLCQPNTKSKTSATGVKGVPRGFKEAVDAMKEAEKAGEDTFPRSWVYVLHNYILPQVNTASKDSWEPHLINAGFCYNPMGMNRGRAVNAQVMDGGAIDIPDPGLYVVDADEKIEGNIKVYDFYFSDGTNVQFDQNSGQSLFAEGGGKSQEMSINDVPEEYTSLMTQTIQADKQAQGLDLDLDKFEDEGELDKDIEMEVSDEPVEVAELLQKMYPGTRTPMEREDQVKFHGGRGRIIDIDPDNDYIIIGHKGIEYRVKVDEIEPLPSTFKKMYM